MSDASDEKKFLLTQEALDSIVEKDPFVAALLQARRADLALFEYYLRSLSRVVFGIDKGFTITPR